MKISKRNKNSGFTLIELLVVISIIGLLSSVVLASLVQAREKARNAVFAEGMHSMEKALEIYKLDTGLYPDENNPENRGYEDNTADDYDRVRQLAAFFSQVVPKYIADYPHPLPSYGLYPDGFGGVQNHMIYFNKAVLDAIYSQSGVQPKCGEEDAKGYILIFEDNGTNPNIPLPHPNFDGSTNWYCITGN